MIRELDDVLTAWLRALAPDAEVSFERPSPGERATGDCLRLRLLEVREDAAGALAGWSEQRAGDGTLAARLSPLRRYRLTYWLSAYASTVRAEHELLSRVLCGLAIHDVVPAEHVVAGFGELPPIDEAVVFVRVAPEQGLRPLPGLQPVGLPAGTAAESAGWPPGWPPDRAGLEIALLSALPRIVDDRIPPPPSSVDLRAGRPAYSHEPADPGRRPGPVRRIQED